MMMLLTVTCIIITTAVTQIRDTVRPIAALMKYFITVVRNREVRFCRSSSGSHSVALTALLGRHWMGVLGVHGMLLLFVTVFWRCRYRESGRRPVRLGEHGRERNGGGQKATAAPSRYQGDVVLLVERKRSLSTGFMRGEHDEGGRAVRRRFFLTEADGPSANEGTMQALEPACDSNSACVMGYVTYDNCDRLIFALVDAVATLHWWLPCRRVTGIRIASSGKVSRRCWGSCGCVLLAVTAGAARTLLGRSWRFYACGSF